jgi:DNA repair photolyase
MEQFARAGILTGACFMPILPGLCDDDANLYSVVRWTADHGGRFVLASGSTLADQQRDFFFGALREHLPDLIVSAQGHLWSHSSAHYPWRKACPQQTGCRGAGRSTSHDGIE